MEYYIHEVKEEYGFNACKVSNINTAVEINDNFWTINTDFEISGNFNLPDQLININYVTSFAKISNIPCLQTTVCKSNDLNIFKYHSSYLISTNEYDYFNDPIYQQFINFSTYFTFNTALASQYDIDDSKKSDSDFITDIESTLYDQKFRYSDITMIEDNIYEINVIEQLNNNNNKIATINYQAPLLLKLDNFNVIHDLFNLSSATSFNVTDVKGQFHFYLNNDLNRYITYDYHDSHKYLNINKLDYQIVKNIIIQNDGFMKIAKENGLASTLAGVGDYELEFELEISNVKQHIEIRNNFSYVDDLFNDKQISFNVVKKNFNDLNNMIAVYNND